MLETARKMRSMDAGGARHQVDAHVGGILDQTLACLRQPRGRRPSQRFCLDASQQVLNAVADVHIGRHALCQHPFQQHTLRNRKIPMDPAARGRARHDVLDVDGENQRTLWPELDLMFDLVRTQAQLRPEPDLVAAGANLADAAADDDRHMRVFVNVRRLPQPRRIKPKSRVCAGSGQRQRSDCQAHARTT